ncbi:MAG: hypothetical protein NVS2B12_12900 [Ktedonobacteraceae bacterium]
MNEHGRDDHGQPYKNRYPDLLVDRALGERISRYFQDQAEHVHFTPNLREHLMRRVPSRHQQRPRVLVVTAFACAAILVLALTFNAYLTPLMRPSPSVQQQIQYTALQELHVSPELANGGQLFSIDPTEQRVVYQAADQNGVFYTARLRDPITSNTLAMRYARDIAWSPDGSALVATVSPEGSFLPLLALAPDGQYMHLLGHDALAAAWSPTSKQLITYVIQEHSQTQIWSTNTEGKANTLLATMPLSLLARHMLWSPNGRYLALMVTSATTPTRAALDQPAQAIYVFDMQTHTMHDFTAAASSHIGHVEWSPNGKDLAYEQITANNVSSLQAVNIEKSTEHFSIVTQRTLDGWSWSPDGRALVYSDGGVLGVHMSYGQTINFSQNKLHLVSPFWLKNGNIVCLRTDQSLHTLQFFGPRKK